MNRLIITFIALAFASTASAQSTFLSSATVKAPKKGNLYGIVECDGKPMPGVAVSDGKEIVLTDNKGCYTLQSEKKRGYVFISIPSCCEAPVSYPDPVPAFWAVTDSDPKSVERHDFTLKHVDNMRHAVVAVTDIHISNMKYDVEQFSTLAMPRINAEVEKYRSQGIPVYTICAGDSSFDIYWYDFMFDIMSFRDLLRNVSYPTPYFNTMGNHDNDGATVHDENTDFNAEQRYRQAFGPTYYSANIGAVHYLFVDDIIYLNDSYGTKKPGMNIAGTRNYLHGVSKEQQEWIARDLALVKDKSTPIVVVMHSPVFQYWSDTNYSRLRTYFNDMVDGKKIKSMDKAVEFASLFSAFENVHFVTGHTHRNKTTYCADDASHPELRNIIDHNIGALSGCWWGTYTNSGVSLGPDNATSGFEVFPVDGKKIEWYWASLDCNSDVQCRCFDGNEVRRYYRENAEMRAFMLHYPETRMKFDQIGDNEVFIHAWAWNPRWTITVTENGKSLDVRHTPMENPQYTVAYYIPKTNWKRLWPKSSGKDIARNMFTVTASSPTSTLTVTIRDEFGHEYTQTMNRPKDFSRDMK